jgi:hypothetical protein
MAEIKEAEEAAPGHAGDDGVRGVGWAAEAVTPVADREAAAACGKDDGVGFERGNFRGRSCLARDV